MASSEVVTEQGGAVAEGKHGLPLIRMVLMVVVAMVVVLAIAGGVGFWLLKSGKLGTLAAPAKAATAAPAEAQASKASLVALDPLLVNLADADNRSYLRITVTLRVEERETGKAASAAEEKPAKGKPLNKHEAEEQDALLAVLGRETAEELLSPEGKDRLKLQMLTALRSHIPDVTFKDVLFTEFLVQQ